MKKQQTVLVVGGAGYVGSHVCKLLSAKGYPIVVFDNLSTGHRDLVKWGKWVYGDLNNEQQLRECFQAHSIHAVMHFSAFSEVGESVTDPSKYYNNNVANTIHLLDAMRDFDVRYFIFSSTCAIYGQPQQIPIPESHSQSPVNPYGRTKWMIEQIAADYDKAYGLKYVHLRYFNAAGADPEGEIGEKHDPETHLIPRAIFVALGRESSLKIFGTDYSTKDGTCIRDYIHVNDLADAHWRALECLQSENRSDCFNLGNGSGYSVREVIDLVQKVSGKKIRVEEVGRRDGDPPVLVGSCEKAWQILQWKPEWRDLTAMIETAYRWHKKRC